MSESIETFDIMEEENASFDEELSVCDSGYGSNIPLEEEILGAMEHLLFNDEVGEDDEKLDPESDERDEIYRLIVLNHRNICHVCSDQLEDESLENVESVLEMLNNQYTLDWIWWCLLCKK